MSSINKLRKKVSELKGQLKENVFHAPVLFLDKDVYEQVEEQLNQPPNSNGLIRIEFPSGEIMHINNETIVFIDDVELLD